MCQFEWTALESHTGGVLAPSNRRKSNCRLWGDPSQPQSPRDVEGENSGPTRHRTNQNPQICRAASLSLAGIQPQCCFLTCVKNKHKPQDERGTSPSSQIKTEKKSLHHAQHKRKGFSVYKKPPKRDFLIFNFFDFTLTRVWIWVFIDSHYYWSYILKQVNGFHTSSQKHDRKWVF